MDKKWYVSKTVWVNALAIVGAILGGDKLDAQTQVLLLGVINLILRAVTKENLIW